MKGIDRKIKKTKTTCPKCGAIYYAPPSATSRDDGETQICPDCGIRESLIFIGVKDEAEREHIVNVINKSYGEKPQK